MPETVIIAARRTPCGNLQGELSSLTAPQLGSAAIRAVLDATPNIAASDIEEVMMGCVLPAGVRQAPARQAARGAGVPDSVPATTVNKMCGSGMKTVMLADDAIRAGRITTAIAGGMESMSNAPHLLLRGRTGIRLGDGVVADHMFEDGLRDAYNNELMGVFAEQTASKLGITRKEMDDFAVESVRRALAAQERGEDTAEIVPVSVRTRKGEVMIEHDEQPGKSSPEKIPHLKPAFAKDGTVTPANSSCISDGAAVLLLAEADYASKQGLTPLARIVSQSVHSRPPEEFTIAPSGAIEKALAAAGWSTDEPDLFEINEAFAVVTLAAMRELNLPHEKVNVNGGACAIGHPVGASGARIIVTLLAALRARNLHRGVASLCLGGGEATAVALELL